MAKQSKVGDVEREVKLSFMQKQMQIWVAADRQFQDAMVANFRLLEMSIPQMRIVPSLDGFALEEFSEGRWQIIDRHNHVGELIDMARFKQGVDRNG